jgi:hypothetical protein
MDFLEKNLEDIIYETDNDLLMDRGLVISGNKKRQVRIGNYGIADLVAWQKSSLGILYIDIFELKKDIVDVNTFTQAIRYFNGIYSYMSYRKFRHPINFSITLVGKYVDKSDFVYVPNFCRVKIYTYTYDFDGIQFNDHFGYKLTDEGFGNG